MDLTAELRAEAAEADRLRGEASRLLRNAAARAARAGMSQRQIAAAMGRSQPEIHRLLLRSEPLAADGRPRRWMSARSAADAISQHLASGDEGTAMRMLLQAIEHLKKLEHPDDISEWLVEPAPLADPRFDTLIRVLTARVMHQMGCVAPEWTLTTTPLSHDWVIPRAPSQRARAMRETPSELAAVNIFMTENDLVSL